MDSYTARPLPRSHFAHFPRARRLIRLALFAPLATQASSEGECCKRKSRNRPTVLKVSMELFSFCVALCFASVIRWAFQIDTFMLQ